MSKYSCKNEVLKRLGMDVVEFVEDPSKVLKQTVWYGGEDKYILVKHLRLPDPELVKNSKKVHFN